MDVSLLRQMTRWLLREPFQAQQVELCLHLVGSKEITRLNETYLAHAGTTDVIAFDHSDQSAGSGCLRCHSFHGEIFISIDDAVAQAGQFHTTWESELARYVIHGLLHLAGYDDLEPVARREMKREEGRLLQAVSRQFPVGRLGKPISQPQNSCAVETRQNTENPPHPSGA
ncbi:MAG: rRNA maturation RNase YbeY, partial [Verrucomicrobia bacterium]|nr:rRNA maturation RNase YbeY [Verrucomicrobiota bacterium]